MQSAPPSAPPSDSRPRAKTLGTIADRAYAAPTYFSVETESGETVVSEVFDLAEALTIARAEEGRVVWAHGRRPHVMVFCRWRVEL